MMLAGTDAAGQVETIIGLNHMTRTLAAEASHQRIAAASTAGMAGTSQIEVEVVDMSGMEAEMLEVPGTGHRTSSQEPS